MAAASALLLGITFCTACPRPLASAALLVERGQQVQQRGAQCFELGGGAQPRPVLLYSLGGRMGDRRDTGSALCEEHQLRAVVTWSAVLREHLAQRDIEPETWYALQLLAIQGPGMSREALSRDLEGSRTMTPNSTRELLARLAAEGLIRGDARIDLTPEGEALHRGLREYISGPTARLLSQFDIDDIETTVRTLQAITKRAEQEAAAAA
jgi:DNA-binding MarR family transcriptional regulator